MIAVVWCATIASILFSGVLYALIVTRLHRYHPVTWKNLGEPHVLLAASRQPTTIGAFLRNGKYRELGDRKLIRLAGGAKVAMLLTFLLFCLGVVLILIAMVQNPT